MPCNCGKKGKVVSFTHTDPEGNETTGLTETQARAAQIRTGGSITPVTK